MEGEISKQHSTESLASSGSHMGCSSEFFFDLSQHMADCLAASNKILSDYPHHQSEIDQLKYTIL